MDDFGGKHLDPDKWLIQSTALTGFRNNQECYGAEDNVVVDGGVLSLTVRSEPAPFVCQDPAAHSPRSTPAAW